MWDPLGMAETLVGIIRRIRDVDPSSSPFITVCQAGRASSYLSTLAILLGCNVRVGKEDAIHVVPHKDDKIVVVPGRRGAARGASKAPWPGAHDRG